MIARNESPASMSGESRAAPRWDKAGELAAVALALALFTALLYARLLFTNRVLASGDILHYFYPYRDFAAAALRPARFPSGTRTSSWARRSWPTRRPRRSTRCIGRLAGCRSPSRSIGPRRCIRGCWAWAAICCCGAGEPAWAGLAAGLALAGSGFYGGLIGHINQMNGAAWLPWAVLALDVHGGAGHLLRRPELGNGAASFGLLVALMFLGLPHTDALHQPVRPGRVGDLAGGGRAARRGLRPPGRGGACGCWSMRWAPPWAC